MRPFALIALGLALTSAGAACGGGKKGKTTPAAGDKTGGTDPKGMTDTDGDGVPDVDGSGAGGSGSGSGSDGDVTLPGGGGGSGDEGDADADELGVEPATPEIVPPNFDISPQQARSEVQKRIAAAKAYLGGRPPDSDGAIREARAALAADGTNIDAIVVIAHANYLKRLYDTAEVILDDLYKHRSTSQTNPYLYYVYGLVYDAIDEDQKAFVAYRKATELDASYAAALVNLGVHQLANKQYDDARGTYERLTQQLARNDAPTWNGLGSAYRGKAADYEPSSPERATWLLQAEQAFKKAQGLDRNYGPAYYNLGLLYLDADPFPGDGGAPLDTLVRLNKARTYFDEYKNLPGVDMALYDERAKDVTKLIKREEKKRKKAAADAGGAAPTSSGAPGAGTTPAGSEPLLEGGG
jgi:tetratricopeptide (TPR) repeat protein